MGPHEAVIETVELNKRYHHVSALDRVSLRVPRGAVYGLLGRNGAGKSTLLKILLGMQEPTSGSVRVLGVDPLQEGAWLRARAGFVPERLPIYDWMTVTEALRFTARFYPGWDGTLSERLLRHFDLPLRDRIGRLSRGMRAQLNLVLALSYRPELLLLDECTSGLDAVLRREFAQRIIETTSSVGRTVLFASHQVAELERFCDWIGVLDRGKLLAQEPLEGLRARVKRLHFSHQGPAPVRGPGILAVEQHGRLVLVTVSDYSEATPAVYAASGTTIEIEELSLEEIFVAIVGAGGNADAIVDRDPALERVA